MDADSLQLSVRIDDGRLDDVRIAALPPEPDATTPRLWVYLSPPAAATIDPDDIAALAAQAPRLRDYGRRFWAKGDTLTLPNSKLAIHFASGSHDWASGCHDVVDCFTPNC